MDVAELERVWGERVKKRRGEDGNGGGGSKDASEARGALLGSSGEPDPTHPPFGSNQGGATQDLGGAAGIGGRRSSIGAEGGFRWSEISEGGWGKGR